MSSGSPPAGAAAEYSDGGNGAGGAIAVVPGRPTWQQTMLRIRDPAESLAFYRDVMGMTHIDTFHFPQYKFSLYFLTTLPPSPAQQQQQDEQQQQHGSSGGSGYYSLTPGTQEAHDYLWNMEGVALELTHNHGTEKDKRSDSSDPALGTCYHPGNQERDGFGHIAVNVDDVQGTCDRLETLGVTFNKKPNEGRMRNLAFVYDPDRYGAVQNTFVDVACARNVITILLLF
jgi:lactoylglutathione lyase